MNLPPLQSHNHPDFPSMRWTDLEMDAIKAYALLAIKTVCGGKHPKKFSGAEVYRIRDMHKNGCGYKQVNKYYSMSERTFRNIVNKQGAYK
jgi:hypothetical protein